MSPSEFEEKLRRLNRDFRVKRSGEVDYADPLHPKHVQRAEVWCKDGYGKPYLIRSYRDPKFTPLDVDWYAKGERARKRAEQVKMIEDLKLEREAQVAAIEKRDSAERIESAKYNFKAAREFCRENGIRGCGTTVLDPGHKIRVFT